MIYNIVLDAQKAAIKEVKVGLEFISFSRTVVSNLAESMTKAGFIKSDAPSDTRRIVFSKAFMPHGLGHLLGLDVHDCTIYPTVMIFLNIF